MTRIRIKKSGKVGYMLAIMPQSCKHGFGKKAIVLYAVDPATDNRTTTAGARYVTHTAFLKDIEIDEPFEWETNTARIIPNRVVSDECGEGKSKKKAQEGRAKRTFCSARFEASKEFANMESVGAAVRKRASKNKKGVV